MWAIGRGAAHTRKRSDTVRTRIEKALRDMRKQNAAITISRVSRRAGVTRKSIYRHDDLVARIRGHRPVEAVTDDPPSIPQNRTIRRRRTAVQTARLELPASGRPLLPC